MMYLDFYLILFYYPSKQNYIPMQEVNFSWHFYPNPNCATLKTENAEIVEKQKFIRFSKEKQFNSGKNHANELQLKLGKELSKTFYDRFPVVRKVTFDNNGITITKNDFVNWENAQSAIEEKITEILTTENKTVLFEKKENE